MLFTDYLVICHFDHMPIHAVSTTPPPPYTNTDAQRDRNSGQAHRNGINRSPSFTRRQPQGPHRPNPIPIPDRSHSSNYVSPGNPTSPGSRSRYNPYSNNPYAPHQGISFIPRSPRPSGRRSPPVQFAETRF